MADPTEAPTEAPTDKKPGNTPWIWIAVAAITTLIGGGMGGFMGLLIGGLLGAALGFGAEYAFGDGVKDFAGPPFWKSEERKRAAAAEREKGAGGVNITDPNAAKDTPATEKVIDPPGMGDAPKAEMWPYMVGGGLSGLASVGVVANQAIRGARNILSGNYRDASIRTLRTATLPVRWATGGLDLALNKMGIKYRPGAYISGAAYLTRQEKYQEIQNELKGKKANEPIEGKLTPEQMEYKAWYENLYDLDSKGKPIKRNPFESVAREANITDPKELGEFKKLVDDFKNKLSDAQLEQLNKNTALETEVIRSLQEAKASKAKGTPFTADSVNPANVIDAAQRRIAVQAANRALATASAVAPAGSRAFLPTLNTHVTPLTLEQTQAALTEKLRAAGLDVSTDSAKTKIGAMSRTLNQMLGNTSGNPLPGVAQKRTAALNVLNGSADAAAQVFNGYSEAKGAGITPELTINLEAAGTYGADKTSYKPDAATVLDAVKPEYRPLNDTDVARLKKIGANPKLQDAGKFTIESNGKLHIAKQGNAHLFTINPDGSVTVSANRGLMIEVMQNNPELRKLVADEPHRYGTELRQAINDAHDATAKKEGAERTKAARDAQAAFEKQAKADAEVEKAKQEKVKRAANADAEANKLPLTDDQKKAVYEKAVELVEKSKDPAKYNKPAQMQALVEVLGDAAATQPKDSLLSAKDYLDSVTKDTPERVFAAADAHVAGKPGLWSKILRFGKPAPVPVPPPVSYEHVYARLNSSIAAHNPDAVEALAKRLNNMLTNGNAAERANALKIISGGADVNALHGRVAETFNQSQGMPTAFETQVDALIHEAATPPKPQAQPKAKTPVTPPTPSTPPATPQVAPQPLTTQLSEADILARLKSKLNISGDAPDVTKLANTLHTMLQGPDAAQQASADRLLSGDKNAIETVRRAMATDRSNAGYVMPEVHPTERVASIVHDIAQDIPSSTSSRWRPGMNGTPASPNGTTVPSTHAGFGPGTTAQPMNPSGVRPATGVNGFGGGFQGLNGEVVLPPDLGNNAPGTPRPPVQDPAATRNPTQGAGTVEPKADPNIGNTRGGFGTPNLGAPDLPQQAIPSGQTVPAPDTATDTHPPASLAPQTEEATPNKGGFKAGFGKYLRGGSNFWGRTGGTAGGLTALPTAIGTGNPLLLGLLPPTVAQIVSDFMPAIPKGTPILAPKVPATGAVPRVPNPGGSRLPQLNPALSTGQKAGVVLRGIGAVAAPAGAVFGTMQVIEGTHQMHNPDLAHMGLYNVTAGTLAATTAAAGTLYMATGSAAAGATASVGWVLIPVAIVDYGIQRVRGNAGKDDSKWYETSSMYAVRWYSEESAKREASEKPRVTKTYSELPFVKPSWHDYANLSSLMTDSSLDNGEPGALGISTRAAIRFQQIDSSKASDADKGYAKLRTESALREAFGDTTKVDDPLRLKSLDEREKNYEEAKKQLTQTERGKAVWKELQTLMDLNQQLTLATNDGDPKYRREPLQKKMQALAFSTKDKRMLELQQIYVKAGYEALKEAPHTPLLKELHEIQKAGGYDAVDVALQSDSRFASLNELFVKSGRKALDAALAEDKKLSEQILEMTKQGLPKEDAKKFAGFVDSHLLIKDVHDIDRFARSKLQALQALSADDMKKYNITSEQINQTGRLDVLFGINTMETESSKLFIELSDNFGNGPRSFNRMTQNASGKNMVSATLGDNITADDKAKIELLRTQGVDISYNGAQIIVDADFVKKSFEAQYGSNGGAMFSFRFTQNVTPTMAQSHKMAERAEQQEYAAGKRNKAAGLPVVVETEQSGTRIFSINPNLIGSSVSVAALGEGKGAESLKITEIKDCEYKGHACKAITIMRGDKQRTLVVEQKDPTERPTPIAYLDENEKPILSALNDGKQPSNVLYVRLFAQNTRKGFALPNEFLSALAMEEKTELDNRAYAEWLEKSEQNKKKPQETKPGYGSDIITAEKKDNNLTPDQKDTGKKETAAEPAPKINAPVDGEKKISFKAPVDSRLLTIVDVPDGSSVVSVNYGGKQQGLDTGKGTAA